MPNALAVIIASSATTAAAKFWSYLTTSPTGSRFSAIASNDRNRVAGGLVSNGTDNDNLLVSYNTAGTVNYQFRTSTAAGTDQVFGVAIDSTDNLYYVASGPSNVELISKVDSTGAQTWAKTTSYTNATIFNMKTDAAGNIYIVGIFSVGTTNYQWLMKMSSTPAVTWVVGQSKGTNAGRNDSFDGLAIDSASNVYVCGKLTDNAGGSQTGQLYKFNSSGTLQFGKGRGGLGNETIFYECAVDSADNLYLAFSTNLLGDAALSKFNSAGTLQWSRATNGTTSWTSLAVDSAGNAYVANNQFVAKFDTSGTLQWQRQIKYNTTLNVIINGLSIDQTGQVVNVTGYIGGGSVGFPFYASLALDGTGTGTYTVGIYTVTYSASSLTITSPTYSFTSPTFTPYTTVPTLSDVTTTKTTTTFTNNKVAIV
jgi:hypothetical protein